MENRKDVFEAEQVKRLVLEAGCAEVQLGVQEGLAEITVVAEIDSETEYRCEFQDGELSVHSEQKKARRRLIKHTDMEDKILIQIPADKVFESAEFEIGVGNAKVDKVRAQEDIEVQVGAGKLMIADAESKKLAVSCGVGHFAMKGDVTGNVDVECGMGECELELAKPESEYRFELECGMGKVQVNGTKLAGFGNSHTYGNPDAPGKITVECGMGSVEIRTAAV